MNQLTFHAGSFAGETIRTTEDGGYASVYDIMKVAGVGSEHDDFRIFNPLRATDISYIIQWALFQARSKNSEIRSHADNVKGDVYGVVDLMNTFGDFRSRDVAARSWRQLQTRIIYPGRGDDLLVTCTFQGKPMQHCTISDFLDHILPHITGQTADIIRKARSATATLVSTGSQMAIDLTLKNRAQNEFALQNTKHTRGTEMSGNEANRTDDMFDCRRANDMTYLAQWVQDEAKRKNTLVRQQGTKHLGVVDLMYIFGEYNRRETASTQWRKFKTNSATRPSGTGPESRGFYVSYDFQGKPMDHCTISDFLDHVLPHITGRTVDLIRQARSTTATLVSTGSQMAVDLTNHNARSIQNAPKEIASVVETIRQETETTAMEMVPEEVAEYQITEREWQQEHPYRVEYTNPIRGHVFYMRKSLAHFVTKVQPPPNSPLQLNVGKLGKTSDIVSRHSSYGKDFGVFTNAIVFENRDDLDLFERNVKSLIHKDRTSGTEYFDEVEVSARYKYNCTWDLYEEQARKLVADSVIGVYDTKITLSVDATEIQPKLTDFFECSQTVAKQQPRPMVKVSVTFVQAEGERQIGRPQTSDSGLELQLSNNTVEISRYAYETKKVEVDAQVELKRLELESKRLELESKRLEYDLESKKIDADMQKHANEIAGKTQVELKTEELKSETNKRELELTHEERLVEYELRKLEIETVHRGPHRQRDLTGAEKDAFIIFWNACTEPSNQSVSCRALLDRYQQYTQGNLMLRVIDFNRRLKSIGVCVKRSLGNTGNGVERRRLIN